MVKYFFKNIILIMILIFIFSLNNFINNEKYFSPNLIVSFINDNNFDLLLFYRLLFLLITSIKLNKNNNNILLGINIYLFFLLLNLSKAENSKKLNFYSEISITIKGKGTQQILSNFTDFCGYHLINFNTLPDIILVNGNNQETISKYIDNLEEEYNNITMIWNNDLTDCNGMFYKLSNIINFDFSKFNGKNLIDLRCMFYGCESITSLDISNFDTSLVTDMDSMFNGCKKLTSLNLYNFNTSNVIMMNSLFGDCYNLKTLNISSFDTSLVTNMHHLFFYCLSLNDINIDHFNTKNVEVMTGMFEGCYKLTSLNLRNLNTSKCNIMYAMFYNCEGLKSLNLSTFDTSSVINMQQMFAGCKSLTSLDINNFDTSNVENMKEMFSGCNSLISLNLINFDTSKLNSFSDMFLNIKNNIVYCINEEKESNIISLLSNFSTNNNCTDSSFLKSGQKFIFEKKIFIDNCTKDNIYKYEYNNICYQFCPFGSSSSELNEFLCEIKENIPKINNTNINTNNDIKYNTNNKSDECNVVDFFSNSCNNENNDIIEKEIDDMINNIQNWILNGSLDTLISNTIEGKNEDLIINKNNITFQLTSSSIQNSKKYDNKSIIKLGECEDRLRKENSLNQNDTLLIFKLDVQKEGSLIPSVEYEVYDIKGRKKLNLDICNDTNINILLPVSHVENDLFKHNASSDYYNDICFTYTNENGTDIILNDRKDEFINNNLTLCNANCEFKGYEIDTKMSKCECGAKNEISKISEIKIDKNELLKKFVDINNIMNIKLLKCYKLLFSKEGLINNIGSYILLSIFLITISSIIIFLFKGFNGIYNIIDEIMKKKKKIIKKKEKKI